MGTKHKRKESVSARLALLKPADEGEVRREFGVERRVRDEKLGRDVAMLRLHEGAVANSKLRRSFSRQLEALDGFEHPSVVPILDGGTNDGEGRGFLISPYLDGQTLAEVLSEAPLAPDEAISLTVDLLNGLAAAHHRWLLHGGISPEGILVVREEGRRRARFLHYGFAPVVGEARQTSFGEVLVSVDYAAPEMIRGEAVDPRADVYSVGALLFTLLTGRHPVPAVGNDPVRARVQDKADALPASALADADLYQTLRAVLARALEQDPALRFPSARSFALALTGQTLPALDSFEDPWAWPEACPDGGKCSASGAKIPPLDDRTWSRRSTDRAFRCRACGQDFAGAEQWDARGLCAKGARHKPIPPAEGEGPEDVVYDLSQADEAFESEGEGEGEGERAGRGSDGPPETDKLDRRAAIRELLKNDARMAGLEPEKPAASVDPAAKGKSEASRAAHATQTEQEEQQEREREREEQQALGAASPLVEDPEGQGRHRTSSGRDLSDSTTLQVEDAFHDAWDDTRRQTEAATSRMRRTHTRGVERPEAPSESEPSRPPQRVGRPLESTPATGAPNLFGWQLAVAGLALALAMIGWKYHEATQVIAARDTERANSFKALTNAQTEKAGVTKALAKLKGDHQSLAERAQALSAQLKLGVEAAEKQSVELATRTTERDAARTAKAKLEADLAVFKADLSAARKAADEARGREKTTLAELADAQRKVAEQVLALQQREAEELRLAGELETLRDTEAARRRQLTLAEAELEARARTLAKLEQELSLTTAAKQDAEARIAGLESQLARGQAELQAAGERERRGETELRAARERERTGKDQLAQVERALAESAQRVKQLQEQIVSLGAAGQAAQLEAAQAREQLKAAEEALAKLKAGGASSAQLALLEREKSDLLIELADLEAEREQLDSEGLQLERWLREAEARTRALARAARIGQRQELRLRSVDAQGRASDASSLQLGTGARALAVVEAAAVAPWIEQARQGESLLAIHIEASGGQPVVKLLGYLDRARVDAPPSAGTNLKVEEVEAGHYRVWISQAELRLLKEAPSGAGLGLLLTGGSETATLTRVELVSSALSEDAQARVFGE